MVSATLVLGWVLDLSPSFGETYGPLAGIVALFIWCLLSSIGFLYGAAVAAQLEAARAEVHADRRVGAATPPGP